MNYNDFFSAAETGQFSVFGTGFVSEMFYQGLVSHHHEHNIRCFYVSRPPEDPSFHGFPILPLSEYKGDEPLFIALHPANLSSLNLPERNAVCIYPFLYEYLYGSPLKKNVRIRLADILSVQPADEYWIAARYAGIDGIVKKDPDLTDLYLRCIGMHTEKATAQRRLGSLQKLCEDIRANGFDNSRSPAAVDEDLRIIDGLHRIAAAAYFGVPEIYCDIYPKNPIFDIVLTEKNRLPITVLTEAGFSPDHIIILRKYREKLQQYE